MAPYRVRFVCVCVCMRARARMSSVSVLGLARQVELLLLFLDGSSFFGLFFFPHEMCYRLFTCNFSGRVGDWKQIAQLVNNFSP